MFGELDAEDYFGLVTRQETGSLADESLDI